MAEEKQNYELTAVEQRIARSAQEAGRNRGDITLIAVSKNFGAKTIVPVLCTGQKDFGENRVKEAQDKWSALKNPQTRLHLIGPLQSNKVAQAIANFDVIHTVDRPKIAQALAQEMRAQKRDLTVFVQVNSGEEPQKSGVLPKDIDAFVALASEEFGLNISGLMCIPPIAEAPSLHFALLAKMADRLQLPYLSMGMSADFEIAIKFGATHIRVGSAIFGERVG